MSSQRDFDAVQHFSDNATTYDHDAFHRTLGLQHISAVELAAVESAFGGMAGRDCLDVGVGSARISGVLRAIGVNVTAFDASHEMLLVTRSKIPGVPLIQARLSPHLPFRDGSFSGITAIRVLKYVERSLWAPTLAELHRVLRPNGLLVVEIANSRSLARWGYPHMDVQLASLRQFRSLLTDVGFVIDRVERGARLPFLLYRRLRTPTLVRATARVEQLGDVLLGKSAGARSLILTCRRT